MTAPVFDTATAVIPAQAGIQSGANGMASLALDSRRRGNDTVEIER